jgi:hypothetical protein
MQKRKVIAAGIFVVFVLFGLSYQHHYAGYFCARTGSERGYEEYFRIIKTKQYYKKSWIQNLAEENYGFTEDDHDWRKTIGTYTTLLSKVRAHERAPALYALKGVLVDVSQARIIDLLELDDTLEFVKILLDGTEDERERAIQGLQNKHNKPEDST